MVARHTKGSYCAVYTRKSSEEGLEQDFNSLDAQREACEAFIKSQAGEGWRLVKTRYDDGGISGGTMERPALKSLLADIEARRVDIVVVYKVDRLTRSLADFAKIVEVFDRAGASFVSVTQQFNTTTSMGRLTLNMLLSFAQFEREITGERIRDKIAASKKKGMWMGGNPPLGYDVGDRKLMVNEPEAETVRHIFRRHVALGSVRCLKEELDAAGILSKVRVAESGRRWGGKPFARGALYLMLQNRIYLGEIVHKDKSYPGEHKGIVDQELWDAVQAKLTENRVERANGSAASNPSLLAGLLYDDLGNRMTPSHAVKNGKRYRYYVSRPLITGSRTAAPDGRRIPAAEIERLVADRVCTFLSNDAEIVEAIQGWNHEVAELKRLVERAAELSKEWVNLSPAQTRSILRALIVRIDVQATTVDIHLVPARLPDLLRGNPLDLSPASECAEDADRMTLSVRARFKRVGKETRMIISGIGPNESEAKPDPSLIKLIVKAHRLLEKLMSENLGIGDIAESQGVHHSYVSRLIRLAFLSPEITEAILDGRQPLGLTAAKLMQVSRLPLEWRAQRQALDFS
ncbi:MAG: recombinase family protein [Proteobacteria bacterium]|nr:recombinase family protein [Pseudomonadota bacterium]